MIEERLLELVKQFEYANVEDLLDELPIILATYFVLGNTKMQGW